MSQLATFEDFQTLWSNLDESKFRLNFFDWKKKPENSDETFDLAVKYFLLPSSLSFSRSFFRFYRTTGGPFLLS